MLKLDPKRLFDLIISFFCIILLLPVLAMIALFVYLLIGPPIIFCQLRPGYLKHPFTIYKFRTMDIACDSYGNILPDNMRLSSFGRFLRRTSLDELPEFINVLRGEMSIIGPRPLLLEYLNLYTKEQIRRHTAKPGITGWAQVNGRNAITWEKKFDYDLWYVDHMSLCLDIKILVLTIWKLLKCEGVNQPGKATMEKFSGSGGNREQ